jgi:hypothetical protein
MKKSSVEAHPLRPRRPSSSILMRDDEEYGFLPGEFQDFRVLAG